jgi:hypothetical protein
MDLEKNSPNKKPISKHDLIKFHFSSLVSQLNELPRTVRTQVLTDRTTDLSLAFAAVLADFEQNKNAYFQDN